MYKVLKKDLSGKCHWVNDSEGIPLEFDTLVAAQKLAEIFQANTTHNSTYTVIGKTS